MFRDPGNVSYYSVYSEYLMFNIQESADNNTMNKHTTAMIHLNRRL